MTAATQRSVAHSGTRTAVKVCGITSLADALMAACPARGLGADLLGFIFHEPSPRNVSPSLVAAMDTPEHILRVGVFVRQDADEVCGIMSRARLDLAQLAGNQDAAFCRAVGPHRVMRVFWPERHAGAADPIGSLREEIAGFDGLLRFVLLDAGTSGGGHGRSLDFASLALLDPSVPWWLAGGLGPDNLSSALSSCAPFGVDLNSGVESSPGRKDKDKLTRAMEAIRSLA